MPNFLEVERMLRRNEPLTTEEWVQILEVEIELLRPIFKITTFERLCDIRFGHPAIFVRREKLFSSDYEAARGIQHDGACDRGHTTEGIFYLGPDGPKADGDFIKSAMVGLTRNGKLVMGEAKQLTSTKPTSDTVIVNPSGKSSLVVWSATPQEIHDSGEFSIPEVTDLLRGVLNNIILKKQAQLAGLENARDQIKNIIDTANFIPVSTRT